MTTYLVTGGAGFIGSHIVDALLARGDQVRVLDNFSTGRRENLPIDVPALEVMEGDITDSSTVQQAVQHVDYVLHQAALVSVTQSMADPAAAHAVNVTGTLNVLMAARSADVKRVVLASSCAVYGDSDDLPLKETVMSNPLSPYAASKRIGEVYCQVFYRAYGVPTVCLRYFNIYGPRQNPNGDYAAVIPKFATRMKAGRPPVIYGDGRQTRDFVHVSDVVRANLLACDCDRAIGQILNVASAQRVSLLEIVDVINILLGTRLQPKFEPARAGDIRHSSGDCERLMNLGFRITMALPAGLKQLIA
jgi:UDP-glucose 4-epimerase